MRARRIIARTLAALLVVCLFLGALEVGVRLVRPQKYFSVCVNQWDRDVGTKLIPGIRGFLRCSEYSVDFIINAKGLRDREYPYKKPPGTRRIVCLGDSFTFGYGVNAEETFAKLLERSINGGQTNGTRWEVLNAGIGSTGTANQLLFFETECCKYSPDIVVLCFCPANDFFDNIASRLFTIEGGALVRHEAPYTAARMAPALVRFVPGYRALCSRSHLVNLIRYKAAALHYQSLSRRATKSARQEDIVKMHNELTCALVDALHRACIERKSELVVMFMPPPRVGEAAQWTASLIAHCESQGIASLDLAPFFADAQRDNVQTAYRIEGHWNQNGHAVAARALHDFLLQRGILPQPATPGQSAESRLTSKLYK